MDYNGLKKAKKDIKVGKEAYFSDQTREPPIASRRILQRPDARALKLLWLEEVVDQLAG